MALFAFSFFALFFLFLFPVGAKNHVGNGAFRFLKWMVCLRAVEGIFFLTPVLFSCLFFAASGNFPIPPFDTILLSLFFLLLL